MVRIGKGAWGACAALAAACAWGGYEESETLTVNSGTSKSLAGKIYTVNVDLSWTERSLGVSPLYVNDGATAVLYIPKGRTVTLNGSDGWSNWGTGNPGSPGIWLPVKRMTGEPPSASVPSTLM